MYTRSPLSVVHAGLDILKAKVKVSNNSGQVIIDADTVELVEQIFSSSGTSIDILDDLLVYEHIDSGKNGNIEPPMHLGSQKVL